MTRNRVLIFEDDHDLAFLLERMFTKEGFMTASYSEGLNFRKRIDDFKPDLIILDLMLPGIDGYTICRCIKKSEGGGEAKIIILSARSEECDIIEGYDAGTDDYMTKPFSTKEVIARAKAVLRRQLPKSSVARQSMIKRDQLLIDDVRYEASLSGEALKLTQSEYCILKTLAKQPGRVYTREQLGDRISSDQYTSSPGAGSRNIDVHIRSIRKKLKDHGCYIKTLRGVGYSFDEAY